MNASKRYLDGFTLLELLVVLVILSVVSSLCVSALFGLSEYWNAMQSATALDAEASEAFDVMRGDVSSVVSSRMAPGAVKGIRSDTKEDVRFWNARLEDDRIEFPVEQYNPTTLKRERMIVAYFIQRQNGAPCLVRTATPCAAEKTTATQSVLAANAAGFRMAYFDGKDWVPEWTKPELPQSLRVSLSLVDPRYPNRNIGRKAVFNVNVQ